MSKTRIAVIFGGASSEYPVSLLSASSVIEKLDREKYEIIKIGITRDGRWLYYTGDTAGIRDGTWTEKSSVPAFISPDSSQKCVATVRDDKLHYLPVDVVFPVLHGRNGEDGTIQGLFELAKIPYVGCGVLSSAACMDKGVTNVLLATAGIPKAKFLACKAADIDSNIDEIERRLGYPVFVKPANTGSSVGISKAKNRDELLTAVRLASVHDRKIVIEENIDGAEVECAVLGNDNPIASIVGEVKPANEFYDYEAKYEADSELYIPARISAGVSEKVRKIALEAYKVMGCEGMSRVDFFVKADGSVLLNEINTIPGFTSISMYGKLFEASGIPYPELLDRLVELAVERAKVSS